MLWKEVRSLDIVWKWYSWWVTKRKKHVAGLKSQKTNFHQKQTNTLFIIVHACLCVHRTYQLVNISISGAPGELVLISYKNMHTFIIKNSNKNAKTNTCSQSREYTNHEQGTVHSWFWHSSLKEGRADNLVEKLSLLQI